ncbi:MAG TPA: histidine phosphatase family protein [Streptosporangiaceae bacterium]|nr:histidine phosphatase family protein [Streptosporangiaceae bacterium]
MAIEPVFETHSMTEDNEQGRATGWLPGRLSRQGQMQARQLGQRRTSDGITAVFSSSSAAFSWKISPSRTSPGNKDRSTGSASQNAHSKPSVLLRITGQRSNGVSPQPGEPCPHAGMSEKGSGRIDAVARCAPVWTACWR